MKRTWTILAMTFVIAVASIPEGMAQTFNIGAEVVEVRKLWTGAVQSLAVDGQKRIYVGSPRMPLLYISTDGGNTWTGSVDAGKKFYTCWSLLPIDSGYILAGADDGVFRSKDYGITWERVFWPEPYGSGVSLFMAKNKAIFVGTHRNIFRSLDNGNYWTSVADSTVVYPYVTTFTQLPDSTLVAGCSSGIPNSANGVLMSTDGGTTWKKTSNSGLIDKNIRGVAGYRGGFSQTIFLSTEYGGNYLSTDKGLSWKALPINNRYGNVAFTCSPLGAFIGCDVPDNNGFTLYRQYGASSWIGIPGISDGVWAIAQWDAVTLLVGGVDGLYMVSFYNPTKVEENSVPDNFRLEQNFPNPFNPSTTIKFSLPDRANVDLKIYNTIGQVVETLVQGELSAGVHSYVWNAGDKPSSIYFYQLKAGTFTETKRMLLVK